MDVVWHEAVGVEHDALSASVVHKEGKKRSVQGGIDEDVPLVKGADGDKVAPGVRIIETLQAGRCSL